MRAAISWELLEFLAMFHACRPIAFEFFFPMNYHDAGYQEPVLSCEFLNEPHSERTFCHWIVFQQILDLSLKGHCRMLGWKNLFRIARNSF